MPRSPQEESGEAAMAELSLEGQQQGSSSLADGPPEPEEVTKQPRRKMQGKRSGIETPASDTAEVKQEEPETDDPDNRADGPINTDPSNASTPTQGPSKREKRRAREAAKKTKEADDTKTEKPEVRLLDFASSMAS